MTARRRLMRSRIERGGGLSPTELARLREALLFSSYSYVAGSTHGFYHYPARFSPAIARTVIDLFSSPGDWILDPFMGGGTSVIEGLALGRRVIGVDINSLAHFVANVRTTPLSSNQEKALFRWADATAGKYASREIPAYLGMPVKNLPGAVKLFATGSLREAAALSPRERAFARCVLLRLGQWAMDCRDMAAPRRRRLASKLPDLTRAMIAGLREFVGECRRAGVRKQRVTRHRRLLCRSAVGLEEDERITKLRGKASLVFTSPPYPGVHVLYHRWQYRGRRETAAPYWIASLRDGRFESFYTGGSRTPTGQVNYFRMITNAFRSIGEVIAPDATIVQLVGFADARTQLPLYLQAMNEAGFDEWRPNVRGESRLGRSVPNRKWYARLQGALDASSEVLLFHRKG
jgi:DNA modification methylase